jgi:peptidyl-prolyl cis-trans isomerase D
MVGAFSDYIFDHKTGESDTVKSEFGYHLIEIMSQKGSSPSYKIAYLTQPITASQTTEDAASNAANLFAGDSRDAKSFNANWEKNLRPKGINRQAALDLKPMDFSLQGINTPARSFIKEVFDAGKGDIVGPLRVGSDYIVALVTDINEAGLASAAKARSTVEPVLRNRKKAEIIKKKIGTISTLEAVAAKTGQQLQTVDSVKFNGGGPLGFEPKVIGAAFYAANKGKVVAQPLEGTQGVYVIRVDATGTAPVAAASIEDQRRSLEMQAKQGMMYRSPVEALKKSATIKDNRAKFY